MTEEWKDKIIESPVNRTALRDHPVKGVRIFDTTLRDGIQAPGVSLNSDDIVSLAKAISKLGVDSIEVGFPASGESEMEVIKEIVKLDLGAKLYGLARCTRSDVDAVAGCGLKYVHIFIATSDVHLEYKLRMTREEVIRDVKDTVGYAVSKGLSVMFSCEDATRTDIDYLKTVCRTAADAGAEIINIPDTVGIAVPRGISLLVKEIREAVDATISVHCHNDLGLAVANSLAAVEAGTEIVHTCINGIGERSGNTSCEEFAVCMSVNYGIDCLNTRRIAQVSKLVSRYTGYPIPYNKPVVGRNAFAHEAGIHVHGVINNSSTYEPYPPEMVGMDRTITVGRNSGEHSVRSRLDEMNIDFPDELMDQLMENIKEIAFTGKEINDLELAAIAENTVWKGRSPDKVSMKEFVVVTGKHVTPTATVTVSVNGETRTRSATGNGPVNAAYNAIFQLFDGAYDVVGFRLEAITGGSDSLCEVTIMISNTVRDGRISVGKSVGLDIVDTSADAIMEAINRDYSSE